MKTFQTRIFEKSGLPWVILGAVAVLFPLFFYMTSDDISRQKKYFTRMLLEKGAAVIASIEAGSRAAEMGVHWSDPQLQRLLAKTGEQPDIVYIMVADAGGLILAHSDPSGIFSMYGGKVDLPGAVRSGDLKWRVAGGPGGEKIFEVRRRFSPSLFPPGMVPGGLDPGHIFAGPRVIFVGLDMGPLEEARMTEARHTVFMGVLLLLIAFSGVALLMGFQQRRSDKASLSREKAVSGNLVRHMPAGVAVADETGRVALFNRVAGKILDADPADVLGRDAADALPGALFDLARGLDSEKPSVETEIRCRAGGRDIPLQAGASTLRDESGAFLGHVFLFRDLSTQKALQSEVETSRRLASTGRLAAGVAHEIRNPLSSIKGFATYFMERYGDARENARIASMMISEIERVNRTLGQLLDFAGPPAISKTPLNIQTLLENSIRTIERQAAEQKIEIRTRFSARDPEIRADSDRIAQAFLNLFLNALEAMGEGGILSVCLKDDPGGLEVVVSDTGPGIFEGSMEKIFDPYFTTRPSGSGLGLAMTRNIVKAHGGDIRAANRETGGAEFKLFLKRR
ncbi:conserved hypothetical protein [Candidatus Desulfarcum epimagneticum]|uniref:histidine kinase n=1 Tax=uncultured Desulfobacteraceae bacterium TaxID=218296 RepID=A0A484HR23_9BACT|nr:conserved hypothetical protein [uncultured Desulfobacteraceae bacterium]